MKTQLAAKDSQAINRQNSRWAEITLDNDGNKRIEEIKTRQRKQESKRNEIRQKGQDGGTRCLYINSLKPKSPSLQYCIHNIVLV